MVLLVTLEKKGQREEHRYEDRFLSPDRFQWQSQNRTTQKGKVGQALKSHLEQGIAVHLFMRRTGKIDGRAAPFTYCGQLERKTSALMDEVRHLGKFACIRG